jgi:UDP-N-acetyl-D-glucosamine dehydrogenase
VELANDVNAHMPDYVVRRLSNGLNARRKPINGSRFLLLGLTYKPNTSDARESPSGAVAELLLERGGVVRAVDAHALESQVDERIVLVDLTPDELADADAVVVLTDHDDVDYAALAGLETYVFDARRRVPPSPNVEAL